MTLQTLLNMSVVTDDGDCIGRIYDFKARREGADVLVTHIRVGAAAWVGRLHLRGMLRRLFSAAEAIDLPWEAIGAVDGEVRLKPGWDRARCDECRVPASRMR